ncbi:MAG: potassium channel family protein [Chloroflexi bacterium]|nr:potassium channel family protein [Chloroflexota bacterium]
MRAANRGITINRMGVADGSMAGQAANDRFRHVYHVFILVLTILSLFIMVGLLLPVGRATRQLLLVYENAICIVFLIDFSVDLVKAPVKRTYLVGQRGWLDLLGSIPTLGLFNFTGLLRLARLSRLTRIVRILRRQNQKQLVEDVLTNRGQYAAFVTLLLAFVVLVAASVLILLFESQSPAANITTGGDALWWAIVTITTVGYGDKYPVTVGGRVTAVFVMVAGVGIIGSLAGILSSVLVPPPAVANGATAPGADDELAAVRRELVALRQAVERFERTRQ